MSRGKHSGTEQRREAANLPSSAQIVSDRDSLARITRQVLKHLST